MYPSSVANSVVSDIPRVSTNGFPLKSFPVDTPSLSLALLVLPSFNILYLYVPVVLFLNL